MEAGRRLGLAGFLATAVAYGPARMGFGLFLPQLRADLGLTSSVAGFISGSAFAAFLVAIPAAARLTRRVGPRLPVLAGAIFALAGTAMVAVASSTSVLALGVMLAGASPGLCWSPFNDAAASLVPTGRRPRVLSVVSTGTTIGIAFAATLALIGVTGGMSWRWSWAAFAAAASLSAAVGWVMLPRRIDIAGEGPASDTGTGGLFASLRWPLAAAISFGATSSIYLSFAADAVARAGGPGRAPASASGAVLYLAFGLCGLVGLFSGGIERRVGLVSFLVTIFAASSLSGLVLALGPGMFTTVVLSAGLQGACVMTISAVLSFWTTTLRPEAASTAFAVVLGGMGVGGVAGPVLAGVVLDEVGDSVVFAAVSGCSLATAVAVAAARRSVRRTVEPVATGQAQNPIPTTPRTPRT